MKYIELYRLLRRYGCYDTGEGTKHEKWYSPLTREIFLLPRHQSQEVPSGTLHSILKKAGIRK